MKEMDTNRTAAYVLISGISCTLITLRYLPFLHLHDGNPLLPGLGDLRTLAWPLLLFSAGLLLHGWMKNPAVWVKALLSLAILACMGLGLTYFNHIPASDMIYSMAALALGYVFPGSALKEAERHKGWRYLGLLALSVFCYVAVSVVRGRALHVSMPEQQKMLQLMEELTRVSMTMLLVPVLYFMAMFAFSRSGQWIATRKWFLYLMIIPCLCSFLSAVGPLPHRYCWFWALNLLAQPLTLYLIIILARENKPALWQGRFARIWEIYPSPANDRMSNNNA